MKLEVGYADVSVNASWPEAVGRVGSLGDPVIVERKLPYVVIGVLGAIVVSAAYASIYSRGLFQDGSYYLLRVAQHEGFYLVDPARTSVQIMRQAPIAFLSKFTNASLQTRAQVFSFTMMALPALLCSLCWIILPRDRKAWVLLPLVNLLAAVSATSLLAVGEPSIASGYFWILLFLLVFRTRGFGTQALFLILCWAGFHLHEGAFLLTPTLLAACALRARSARGWQEWLFLSMSAALIVWIFVYELSWVIVPRIPVDRVVMWRAIRGLEFLYADGRVNLPWVTGIVALIALMWIFVVHLIQPEPVATARSRVVAFSFMILAILAGVTAVSFEGSFAPQAQAFARYQPIFVSAFLALTGLLLVAFDIPDTRWARPATLTVIVSLCAAQMIAEIEATTYWRYFAGAIQARLGASTGLISAQSILADGDAKRNSNAQLLLHDAWTIPILSVVFAHDGEVRAILAPPAGLPFLPLDPRRPEEFPQLRGVSFAPYREALSAQRADGLEYGLK